MGLFLIGLGLGLAGAIAGAALPARTRLIVRSALCIAACVAVFIAAVRVLVEGGGSRFDSSQLLPISGVHLELDPLGALFIATTSFVGLAAIIYDLGYSRRVESSRAMTSVMALFLTSLFLVPACSSVTTFMFAWELMAVTSFVLVLMGHPHRAETREAANWYGAMTHIGAAFILLGLLVLSSHAGGDTFALIASHSRSLSPVLRSLAFLLVLVGFASKAGAVPLHVWLPKAHPEAPTPASALMSGAMVNLGIYGIARVGGSLLGGGPLWWWLVVVAFGAVSAVYGALRAMACTDLKRLLAYSTIDNLGLVLIGLGTAGALRATGHLALASLAMLAALFHLLNHSLFKGCLFLGAGAVERATGTRDLDMLGGLARRLPVTTVLFGIGSLAISALPGLNGFSSEWLLLESLLHGFTARVPALLISLLVGTASLALAGGLTVAVFVKALGIGFLGQPRSRGAADAREVGMEMRLATGILALACVALGILPGSIVPMLGRAGVIAGVSRTIPLNHRLSLDLSVTKGAIEPILLVAGLSLAMALAYGSIRLTARYRTRRAAAWSCGRELQTSRMEYTATAFAEPLTRVFENVLRPNHDIEVTHVEESRYIAKAITYEGQSVDGFERTIYRPVISWVRAWGRIARLAQNGSVHRYLAYGFAALVVILAVLA